MTPTFRITAGLTLAACLVQPALAQQGPDGWHGSPHADAGAEAFAHWDDEGEIPGACAVCHSATGFAAYVAGGMGTVGMIDHPVPTGTTVECAVCHDDAATSLASVPMLSGISVPAGGPDGVCAVCHQGRAWTGTLETATEGLEDDAVSADLSFVNPHYGLSAAIALGGEARSGYEYPGRAYAGAFIHVPGKDSCTSCHEPHALEVSLESCTTCHAGAKAFEDIRTSPADFDGDGDVAEGIAREVDALTERLGAAIAAYAANVAGTPVVHAEASYPYFFVDTDADGAVSTGEAAFPNRYASWTPRLLRAAYNYQYAAKNPGAYSHNPHYVLQLLHDSIADLAGPAGLDAAGLARP